MKKLFRLSLVALSLLPLAASASPVKWAGTGQVTYAVVHKFHKVEAVSKFLLIKAVIDDNGLQFTARAPISSFDSGNSNRDAHAMEVVDPEHFPFVTVKGAARTFQLPAPGAKAQFTFTADVDLHGVTVQHPVQVAVETKDATHAKITFHFDESFTQHKMERPSLMFIAVDDAIAITGEANVEAKP